MAFLIGIITIIKSIPGKMNSNKKGIIFAIVTAVFWGFLPIFLKKSVQRIEPETVVWCRFVTAFTILLVAQLFRDPSELKILIRPPKWLLIAAVGLAWNYIGFIQSINYTTPSNAQLIIQLGPVLLTLAGFIFFGEKLHRMQLIGFIIASGGFVLFYKEQLQQMIGVQQRYNMGVIFAVSAAIAWVIYAVMQKKLVLNYSTHTLNLFLFGFPILAYFPFVNFDTLAGLTWDWWLLLFFLGLNTLIAYGSLALALKYTAANKVSIILLLNPAITFTMMALITEFQIQWIAGEKFTSLTLVGALVILVGAILVVKKWPSVSLGEVTSSK